MAVAYASFSLFGAISRNDYACVGAPPEKEVVPEPRRNGATLAAIARVLRGGARRPPGTGPQGAQARTAREVTSTLVRPVALLVRAAFLLHAAFAIHAAFLIRAAYAVCFR